MPEEYYAVANLQVQVCITHRVVWAGYKHFSASEDFFSEAGIAGVISYHNPW